MNPNTTTTSMTTTSTSTIITFHYTSASVCNYDFESVKASYAPHKVEKTNSKTIKVTIPNEQEEGDLSCMGECEGCTGDPDCEHFLSKHWYNQNVP